MESRLDRRTLIAGLGAGLGRAGLGRAGLGAAMLGPAWPGIAAEGRRSLALDAATAAIALRPGAPDAPIWSLSAAVADPGLSFRPGDPLEISVDNHLPAPIALNWHGIDGAVALEPLLERPPLTAGGHESLVIAMRQAGTLLCDARFLGDPGAQPSRACAVVIAEPGPPLADRDLTLLIEDWRLDAAGSAIAAGSAALAATALYSINGQPLMEIPTRLHQRFRLRLINGCQRTIIAIKIEDHEVRVIALDSQPAEPFAARAGALVLAPGGRADTLIDATLQSGQTSSILLHDGITAHPIARLTGSNEPALRSAPLPAAAALPSNDLPLHLDLKNALRVDVMLGGPPASWVTPAVFAPTAPPMFRAKSGRTVVLALSNRAAGSTVFHLHGHHFRLLDRLDDGWKPFWLDTLALEAGQTQRIAFAAQHAGHWLMESMATEWTAPRLLTWYRID